MANHEEIQAKIDKIIDTLQLVEDTSEAEDRFDAHLESTAPEHHSPHQNDDQTEAEMDEETSKAAEQLEQMNKQTNESIDMDEEVYDLECHENGAEMYEMMVEEVHESVDYSSDDHVFDSETHQRQRKFSKDELQEHQFMLC